MSIRITSALVFVLVAAAAVQAGDKEKPPKSPDPSNGEYR